MLSSVPRSGASLRAGRCPSCSARRTRSASPTSIIYGSGARVHARTGLSLRTLRRRDRSDVRRPRAELGQGRASWTSFINDPPEGADAKNARARFERSACTPHMMREIMQRNIEIDVRSLLPAISVPTLVMHNAGDPLIVVDHGRYLAEHIPGAKYIEGDGQLPRDLGLAEARDGCSTRSDDFLGAAGHATSARSTASSRRCSSPTSSARPSGRRRSAITRWRELLDKHDAMARAEIDRCQGRLVKTTGDGILATFDGPARAIGCAQEMAKGSKVLGLESARRRPHRGDRASRRGHRRPRRRHRAARSATWPRTVSCSRHEP